MTISATHLNAFLQSASSVLQTVCNITPAIGAPSRENLNVTDTSVFISLGVTGEMKGQVYLTMHVETAMQIASAMMMGMPVTELDAMTKSALCELGNMIMGNSATYLSNENCRIDITPPTLGVGITEITSPNIASIKVPLSFAGQELCMYFILKIN